MNTDLYYAQRKGAYTVLSSRRDASRLCFYETNPSVKDITVEYTQVHQALNLRCIYILVGKTLLVTRPLRSCPLVPLFAKSNDNKEE